jgi:cardiolipin synthase (CMP-forming)
LNIPNCITITRVLLVPVIFWLMVSSRLESAFFLFVLAGLSDAVDGYLAKRFNLQTELGAHLDPLADKLLIATVFITLGWLGELPSWLVIAVVARDLLIIIAIMLSWLLGHPVRIKPFWVSKANTAAQIVLAATALADTGFNLHLGWLRFVLVWLTLTLTLVSLGAYMRAWLRHMAGYESDQTSP